MLGGGVARTARRPQRYLRVVLVMALLAALATFTAPSAEAQTAPGVQPPVGDLESVTSPRAGRIRVRGWVLDPTDERRIGVHVYVDGVYAKGYTALGLRPDLRIGANHGFTGTIFGVAEGTHRVCAYAIGRAPGIRVGDLGCATVTVASSNPFGALDTVTSPALDTIEISGWAIDPNVGRAVPIHVYSNGRYLGATAAGLPRPDVAAAFPPNHERHGFSERFVGVGYGTHRVCVYAINIAAGTENRGLGCRNVNVMAAPSAEKSEIVINGTGDVRADPWWFPTVAGRTDYSSIFGRLGGLFTEDDLTVINLECTASRLGRPVPKNWNFRCDPDTFAHFVDAGVEVASQANNHALDYGAAAMLDGSAQMWAAGLAEVGSGENAADAYEPVLYEINGWRVAVIGMAGFVEFDWWIADANRPGLASGYDIAQMTAAVRSAKEHADIVVVPIHWGREGVFSANSSQIQRGHALIDAGADIIFGHHPHRLQPLEMYQGRPIFYSLGNFAWPRQTAASRDTAVGQVIVGADGSYRACFLDATIVAHGQPALDDPSRRSC